MDFWVSFWGWLLVLGLTVFAGLAIVVAIGGASDIRAMFRTIREQHDRKPK